MTVPLSRAFPPMPIKLPARQSDGHPVREREVKAEWIGRSAEFDAVRKKINPSRLMPGHNWRTR